ncbi:hypothetical protein PoB_001661800 [Plakobranchus ocellatus]|uniref:RING-type domain-containing protein n=1 Tax=Plakobranchus ocellatus TaxID=259542 RepID=A0AAV3Z6L7_9GAST|nr:hypothetical protein PoB_001661800 [Plakobranchus ocellatus]
MSQEVYGNALASCKCAQCKCSLIDPVQLGACMHILCRRCIKDLEDRYLNNLNCPACGKENAKPSILNRISGIELSSGGSDGEGTKDGSKSCDYDISHDDAMWNCFLCAINMCSSCRSSHPLDHGHVISLLAPNRGIRIFHESLGTENLALPDQADGSTVSSPGFLESVGGDCPMCTGTSCPHIDVLELLHAEPDAQSARCKIGDHKDCNMQQLLKTYFCCECLIPVCGDCSQKGDHKLHLVKPLEAMRDELKQTATYLRDCLHMLLFKVTCDEENEREVEQSLREHVDKVSRLMNNRKCKILEEVTRVFNRTMDDAENQGKDIVRIYSKKLEDTKVLLKFLKDLSSALNIQIDETIDTVTHVNLLYRLQEAASVIDQVSKKIDETIDTVTHVNLLYRLQEAASVIDQVSKKVKQRLMPFEHRLLVSGLDSASLARLSVASVMRECRQPPLAMYFKINSEISLVNSIVVKGSDQCFLSCRMTQERKNDAIIHYQCMACSPSRKRSEHMMEITPRETVTDVQRGKYYITRLATGEIVASYSSEFGNALKYFQDDNYFKESSGEFAQFENITRHLEFEPRGIAATNQNTIVVCMAMPQDKGKSQTKNETSYLMLMSLQGKVLEEAEHQACADFSPNCVATSANGDICVCDPRRSSIAILDSKLKTKEKVRLPCPTSVSSLVQRDVCDYNKPLSHSDIVFSPEGVCYDRFGRIIMADPNNHMVVRLALSPDDRKYELQPLICRDESSQLQHFRYPKLVALGEDGRLWVVCPEYVFIFDYGV